jgi:hypothetical protein
MNLQKENTMNVSKRTQTLIDRLPKGHPLSATMRDAMIAALAASEGFGGHKIALQSDDRMTPKGRSQALRDSLVQNHGKQWARAKAAVAKARKEIEARRAALVIKAVDPTNVVAALERQEIRSWLRTLDIGARQSVALTTDDRRILEAMVTAPPELSNIVAGALAAKIEQRYIELTYPDELASIEKMDAVVTVAEQARHIARNEMAGIYGAHPIEFDKLMQLLEVDRPVLTSDRKQIIEIDAAGKATYRLASQSDIDNGVVFGSDEHKALQAA